MACLLENPDLLCPSSIYATSIFLYFSTAQSTSFILSNIFSLYLALTMPAVLSTLSRTSNPAFRAVESVLADPFLRALFQGAIGSLILDYRPSRLDIVPHLRSGVTTYLLDPQVAHSLWLSIRKIAQIINCAGNDYNPFTTIQPLLISIPPARLRAADLVSPLISLSLAFPFVNPLLVECDSVDDVYNRVTMVRHIANYYVRWMACGILKSVEQGLGAAWNWGSYWGMTWEDFLGRLGVHGPTKPLGELPNGVVDYNGAAVNNSLALILHPTLSSAALALRRRADAVVSGDIPTEPPTDIIASFEHFFLANLFLAEY